MSWLMSLEEKKAPSRDCDICLTALSQEEVGQYFITSPKRNYFYLCKTCFEENMASVRLKGKSHPYHCCVCLREGMNGNNANAKKPFRLYFFCNDCYKERVGL